MCHTLLFKLMSAALAINHHRYQTVFHRKSDTFYLIMVLLNNSSIIILKCCALYKYYISHQSVK